MHTYQICRSKEPAYACPSQNRKQKDVLRGFYDGAAYSTAHGHQWAKGKQVLLRSKSLQQNHNELMILLKTRTKAYRKCIFIQSIYLHHAYVQNLCEFSTKPKSHSLCAVWYLFIAPEYQCAALYYLPTAWHLDTPLQLLSLRYQKTPWFWNSS